MKNLVNKTVFITGGLSGIGKACAIEAAKHGANIVVADLRSKLVEAAIEDIKKENSKVLFVECDVSEFQQVEAAIRQTVSTFKTLDVAFNIAGISGKPSKVGEMSEEVWLQVIGINLNGVFNCMRHELNQMAKQQSGVIVNMSSAMGKVGTPLTCHYVAAKHGVIGLTQTAALEYATEGIRINAICPGFVESPFLTKAHINSHPDFKQHLIDVHPLKRLGKPEEIAKAFIFLASDDSAFITGTTLDIDGGYLAQ